MFQMDVKMIAGRLVAAAAFVWASALSGGPAAGQEIVSANMILDAYYHGTPTQKSAAVVALATAQELLAVANVELRTERHEKPLYCAPLRLSLTGDQVAQILQQFIQRDPGMGERQWSVATTLALELVFPCP